LTKLLPYILFEKYIHILALEMASSGNQHYDNCIGALSFAIGLRYWSWNYRGGCWHQLDLPANGSWIKDLKCTHCNYIIFRYYLPVGF